MGKETHFPLKNTRRKLELNIAEGKSLSSIEAENMYSYWNITCKSSGFVYNQVFITKICTLQFKCRF